MITMKERIRGNCEAIADIAILGIAICTCCFMKWLNKLSEKELDDIKEKFAWVGSNDVISWPDGMTLFGVDINSLDETKPIVEHKKEMELRLIEYGLINNKDYTIYSDNVEFLFGTLIQDELVDDEKDEIEE